MKLKPEVELEKPVLEKKFQSEAEAVKVKLEKNTLRKKISKWSEARVLRKKFQGEANFTSAPHTLRKSRSKKGPVTRDRIYERPGP